MMHDILLNGRSVHAHAVLSESSLCSDSFREAQKTFSEFDCCIYPI